jgi:hypothetical protein
MKTSDINPARRKFLLMAGCAPAIGAAVLLARSTETKAQILNAVPVDPDASGNYHETDHIRKYYRLAGYI